MTMRNVMIKSAAIAVLSTAILMPIPSEAGPKKAKPLLVHPVFDAEKRKKTKHKVGRRLSYSVYAGATLLNERNQRRDDALDDRTEERAQYLGFVGRADLGRGVIAFGHGELTTKTKTTSLRSYVANTSWFTKEAFLSFMINDETWITAGRMRFSDLNKWVADSVVDGVHYGRKTKDRVVEFAALRGVDDVTSKYLLAHVGRVDGKVRYGAFGLAEKDGDDKRLHLSAYLKAIPTKRATYEANIATVLGDAALGQNTGVGFDLRTTQQFGNSPLNPQIMIGLAAGSKGFRQSGIHSNKTYNGGQTQVHRYGFVFQPDLTNLAVGSVAVGIRPSRKLSIDLGLHVYGQISKSTEGPSARFSGATTGTGSFLGSEISLVGAWRPNKKSKVQFGVGHFEPGPAFRDQSSATRVYVNLSVNF